MNPTRLVLGVLLLSLCVFGLPEGCLVFASHEVAPALPVHDTDPADRITPEWFEKIEALTFSARDAE
jgi:hypothetical protein